MPRSRETLDQQKRLIRVVLESIGEDGWISYGESTDKNGHDRAIVLPGKGESLGVQRSPRNEAEFCAVVRHIVDEGHPHVRWYLRAAVQGLDWQDRQILRLRITFGHSCSAIKRGLRLGSRYAVDMRVEQILGELARALWDEQGLPLVPDAQNPRAPSPVPGVIAARSG